MSMQGVDYSVRPKDWSTFFRSLKAVGYSFVGRYLASEPGRIARDRRALSSEELFALRAAGLDVYVFWENSPDHVAAHTERRALDGYQDGVEDARAARAAVEHLGGPRAAPIYFTVDTDTTGGRVEPYFRGVLSVLGDVRLVGVYGGYRVVRWLLDQGLVGYACQTEAWSKVGGQRVFDERAQIRQYTLPEHGAKTVAGVACDLNVACAEDFGQWFHRPEEEDVPIDVVHAPEQIQAAAERLTEVGLLKGEHRPDDAASVGFVLLLLSRLFERIPPEIDLSEYELKLVRRQT